MLQVNDIGALTYFRASNVWVFPDAFRVALNDNGFSSVELPDLAKLTVSRAVRAADAFRTPEIRVDVVAVDGVAGKRTSSLASNVDFGLLQRVQISDSEVRWEQFDSVRFDRASGWSGGQTETAQEFIETGRRWQTQFGYSTVRRITMDLLAGLGAFCVGGSGVFYVHGPQMTRFSAIRSMVHSIPGARLHSIRVDPADAESVAAVGDAARESMSERVAEVVAKLGEWRERARGRKSTLENLLGDLQAVRDEAAGLCGALRFSTTEIETAIASASAEVTAALQDALQPLPESVAVPAEVPAAPVPVEAPAVETSPPASLQADPLAVATETVVIPDNLEGVDSFELRKLARRVGISAWATKPRPLLIEELRASA